MAVYGDDLKTIIKQFEAAHKLFWKGEHGKALAEFEKIVATAGLDSIIKDKVGSFIIVCKERATKDDFELSKAEDYYLAGTIDLNNQDTEESVVKISKAVEMEPENAAYVYLLACAQLENGDPDQALETIRKAIDMDGTNKIYARNNNSFAEEIKENEAFADLLLEPVEETPMLDD